MFKFHPRILQSRGYWDEANDGAGKGSGGGGGSGGSGDDDGKGSGGGDDGKKTGGGDGDGDGGKKPTEAEAKLLKDLMKVKTTNTTLQEQLAQATARLASFDGIDPAKVRELLKNIEDDEKKKAEARGEYDRIVAQMSQAHQAELARLQEQIDNGGKGQAALLAQIAELTVGSAFKSSEFLKELTLTPAKAKVIYGTHFEFKDGGVVAYDKPAGSAERTPLVGSDGKPLGFEDALKKLVDSDPDRDSLYRSKMKPGAGSGTQGKEVTKAKQEEKLTPAEKIARGLRALAEGAK